MADGEATFDGLSQALEAGYVDKVGFTGSSEVGSKIGELTGRHLQSACLELGGKNPMVVTPTADLDLAAEAALFSGFGTAGQRCTSLGTVIVHESVHDDFLARFDKLTQQAAVGDPNTGRGLRPDARREVRHAVRGLPRLDPAAPHRARLVRDRPDHGRQPARGFVGDPDAGVFYHPTIVDGVREDDEIFRNETFGPLVGVTTYRDLDEAIRLANAPGYGLSSSIYTTDAERRLPVPPRHQRRHGQHQQLDVRRRGAPSVRRQRKVGQRLAAVRRVGARPVHPLAVDELGLLGPAAEGADGRRGAHPGRVVPACRTRSCRDL